MLDTVTNRRPALPAKFPDNEIAVSKGAPFMEAVVAAYAIIAHADGEIALAERRRLMTIARNEPRLAPFSHEDVAQEFAMHEANYRLDNEVANVMALEKITPMRARRRSARAFVHACREAIVADGIIHPAEMRALAKIKQALGLELGTVASPTGG